MVKKRKLRYKNFNICQLIDKGKMKLQYTDQFKESKRNFGKNKKHTAKTKGYVIKNINVKVISGILAFTLVTSLSGCANVSIDNIKYKKDEQGYVQCIENTIGINTLKYCAIYKVRNVEEQKLYHTICLRDDFNGTYQVKYYDIFTGEELKHSNYNFRMIEDLDDYLEQDKLEYTEEELREMLNKFLQKEQQYKKLVKE